MTMLPEELLHLLAEYLAYNPDPVQREVPDIHFKHATAEIRAFSMVSRQLRRICLPFLFAYVRIKYFKGIRSFRDQVLSNAQFGDSIKTLTIGRIVDKEGCDIVRELLPRLKRLSWIHFYDIETDAALFTAIHNQKNIQTVVIDSLSNLPRVDSLQLSKVLLRRFDILHPRHLEPLMSRGMQVAQLTSFYPYLLQEEFVIYGSKKFNGLRELDLQMCLSDPITLSRLSEFTSAHPLLRKIRFKDDAISYFNRNSSLPFTLRFMEQVRQQEELSSAFDLTKVVISREPSAKGCLREWVVTELKIVVKKSLDQILPIVRSSFPKLSVLSLEFMGLLAYQIDDLINLIRTFPSLRAVGLWNSFAHLRFGKRKPWKRLRATINQNYKMPGAVMAEAGMLWYTTRIAQAIPSLHAFFVHEREFPRVPGWQVNGWFTVQVSPQDGSRSVVGRLVDDRSGRTHWI
ncbi:hypothetical protein GYMLUDRAFT_35391 [Collybiopsis luxurians FD-317 M1]|nr:hypothetical protein GYMLUDRAFT_35391 [Collybiopsis luxurians FD-317 M1]